MSAEGEHSTGPQKFILPGRRSRPRTIVLLQRAFSDPAANELIEFDNFLMMSMEGIFREAFMRNRPEMDVHALANLSGLHDDASRHLLRLIVSCTPPTTQSDLLNQGLAAQQVAARGGARKAPPCCSVLPLHAPVEVVTNIVRTGAAGATRCPSPNRHECRRRVGCHGTVFERRDDLPFNPRRIVL